jgi:hypothetical protein
MFGDEDDGDYEDNNDGDERRCLKMMTITRRRKRENLLYVLVKIFFWKTFIHLAELCL